MDHAPTPAQESSIAFEEVYRRCFPYVWRTVARLGLPPAEREDAVQQVFLTAYRRRADFDGRSSVEAWLFGICRYTVANLRRRHARRARLWLAFGHRQLREDGEARVERQWARRELERFLVSLDPAKREAFELGELGGLTGREMADALGINPNTAASRLRAARKAFHEHCERLGVEPEFDDEVRPDLVTERRHWNLLLLACPAAAGGRIAPSTGLGSAAVAANAKVALFSAGAAAGAMVTGAVTVLLVSAPSEPPTPATPTAQAHPVAQTGPKPGVSKEPLELVEPAVDEPLERDEVLGATDVLQPTVNRRTRSAANVTGDPVEDSTPPGAAEDRLAAEATLLARLEAEKRAGHHLTVLGLAARHRHGFPDGQLGVARLRAELESLCALGHRDQAERVHAQLARRAPSLVGQAACNDSPR